MTGDDVDPALERLLSDALHERVRGAVGEHSAPPAPRYADPQSIVDPTPIAANGRSRGRVWAPLAAAAMVVAVAGALVAVSRHDDGTDDRAAAPSASAYSAPADAVPVHMSTSIANDVIYGVGMPVVVYLSQTITDGRAFQARTQVTANGRPLATSWYFQRSTSGSGPIEAQLRPESYWPADSRIHVDFPRAGTSLGGRLALSSPLASLDFRIGAKRLVTVDSRTHELTFTDNGRRVAYPVSLGASATPTTRGLKVVMQKGKDVSMRGPGYFEPHVQDAQRLTNAGEYLHSAPWNMVNIRDGVNSSNGCTNMLPADAAALYADLRVGDVVDYPNANGPKMTMGDGYGLWNVSWTTWQTGGLVPTH